MIPSPIMLVRYAVLAFALGGLCSSAEELVHLRNGFCLKADSHKQDGENFVFLAGAGTVALPAEDIELIEVFAAKPSAPPSPAAATETESTTSLIEKAARAEGLDPALVRSVAKIESGLEQKAISPKGAIGLMQLMPGTAAELGVDASSAAENARGGARYLRELLLKYHGNSALALAAYNAGAASVAKYSGVPPYYETRRYVVKVTREYDALVRAEKNSAAR